MSKSCAMVVKSLGPSSKDRTRSAATSDEVNTATGMLASEYLRRFASYIPAVVGTFRSKLGSNLFMVRTISIFLFAGLFGAALMAQTPLRPDVEAQRIAMKKLGFLVVEWSGEASVLRGPGQFAALR
jgi:hypothetical protein